MTLLHGWHRGERAIQEKLGFAEAVTMAYTLIKGEMPDQHREFHTTRLPFIPVVTLDAQGRPWTSIFAGHSGEPGFASSPTPSRLDMDIRVWNGDPFLENAKLFDGKRMLIAGIGIEFSTRRRNKFAGYITHMEQLGDTFHLKTIVNEAIGNCPKYINVRQLDPLPDIAPVVAYKLPSLADDERLPDDVIKMIQDTDTIFLGSTFQAEPEESTTFPSHVGQNQRGGRPGWVRVKPSDGRTVVFPDYSGNRLLSSLGNIEVTPLASVTIVDFVTGDVLYLTGDAHTLVGPEALAVMPRQKVITLLKVTGFTLVRDALPVRQRPNTEPERSPYSPPVRLLAEEAAQGASKFFSEETTVTLASVKLLSRDLATFTWTASRPIVIQPGQTAILDFSDVVGSAQYQHMAASNPASVNDDRIRTWTVSSAHLSPAGTTTFDLTMREKAHGVVTGMLLALARKLAARSNQLVDARDVGLKVKLVGIAGTFVLPPIPSAPQTVRMLWLAGGIGVTPFMSMLAAIAQAPPSGVLWDAVLALTTREPEVLVPLLLSSLGGATPRLRLQIHVYSSKQMSQLPAVPAADNLQVTVIPHQGRIDKAFFDSTEELLERKPYMCGPQEFERAMLDFLAERGVSSEVVVRESFQY